MALDIARLLDSLPATSTEDLLDVAEMEQREMRKRVEVYGLIEAEVLRRFPDSATTLLSERWQCDRVATKSYRWDIDALRAALGPFTGDCYEEVVVPARTEYKVNTRKLLGLAERLGPAEGAAIRAACTIEEAKPRLKFSGRAAE